MKDKTKSILVALSFIVAMILFVWGFNFLKGKSLLRNQQSFYAIYSNSKGLLPGDLVTINGMQVGTVNSLEFHPRQDGSIIVNFIISNELNIPDNTTAKLASSLMGSVSVELNLGNSKTFAQSGDTLTSGYDNGTMGMITETIMPLKDNLESLLISLNNLTLNLDNLLNAELKDNINKSVNNLASSMNNIKDISSDLKLLVDSENGKLTMVVNNLETMTNNFTAVGDSLKNIDYNRVINTLEECATEFNTLIRNINEGQGSAGLLINEDSLYNNINQTIESLQSLIDEIKANPKKIKLSVF